MQTPRSEPDRGRAAEGSFINSILDWMTQILLFTSELLVSPEQKSFMGYGPPGDLARDIMSVLGAVWTQGRDSEARPTALHRAVMNQSYRKHQVFIEIRTQRDKLGVYAQNLEVTGTCSHEAWLSWVELVVVNLLVGQPTS
ncbi:hypothetical protein EVAR_38007_1 [Eumeta japonica]|uniref:Uncharacterized protein n=1 Tax=Eumeta variegata TaxID=151549 RepID=A0A4C1WYD7_EUMVA|nr:hypothetical protein EVAR_38007_1 [Eumeta japonica]